jgi:hypothetical protein
VSSALAAAARGPGSGPIIVVGRPRSGSRVVAALLQDAGVFMGAALDPSSLDPLPILHRFVAPLLGAPEPEPAPEPAPAGDRDRRAKERLVAALADLFGALPVCGPWGWKFCETGLLMPLVKRLLPRARFVHIIRDGRDVCVSVNGRFQLTGAPPRVWPVTSLDGRPVDYESFCRAVTVGEPGEQRWHDIDLADPRQRDEHRYLLQMQSWCHCVSEIRRHGRAIGADYREVRYEELCREPLGTARELLAWAGQPSAKAAISHRERVGTAGIGSWRRVRASPREARDLEQALAHGSTLLREFGYLR